MSGAGNLLGRQAIVVGGSLAGMLAARVLAPHFERVLVLDRDELPSEPAPRRTTPQAHHIHMLLKGGENAIEALLPGFCAELEVRGALTVAGGLDALAGSELGFAPRWDSKLKLHSQSRWLLEHVLRGLVLARTPNLELRSGVRVRGLARDAAANRITGVVTDGGGAPLAADLVIDASGRREEGLRWLEALGLPAPPVESVGVDFGYASVVLELDPTQERDWLMLVVGNLPRVGARGAVILPIEGGRFMCSAGGRAGDYPPAEREAFIAFAASLPQQIMAETLRRARFVSEVARMIYPANRFRHYERYDALPLGLLPVGDALCSFNPTYGQGMSSAALQAMALHETLAARAGDDLRAFSRRYLERAAEVARMPWRQANYNDFLYPTTEGDRSMFSSEEMQYRTALQFAAMRDEVVRDQLGAVGQLLAPFESLLTPEIRARVMGTPPSAPG
ncbi:MAG TPA: FAD-dependent monooxygenase [Myxococcota bacterium]|jgi:2-polyprenyl-6-methoxyphenol hydroxylase-like FAD-dependent oxidoreductase